MRRFAALLVFVVIPSCIALGQTANWINYLDENLYDVAEAAVADVQSGMEIWVQARSRRADALQTLYVDARRERWSAAEYSDRLQAEELLAIAAEEENGLQAVLAGLEVTTEILRQQSPPPASRFRADAVQWFTETGSALGADAAEVAGLVDEIKDLGQNTDDSSARAFVARLGLPVPPEFEDASAQDRLIQVADDWWLVYLSASGDAARAKMLSVLTDATGVVSPEIGSAANRLAGEYQLRALQVQVLRRTAAEAYAVIGAYPIVALSQAGDGAPVNAAGPGDPVADDEVLDDVLDLVLDLVQADSAADLGRFLKAVRDASRQSLFLAALADASTRLAMESAARLLSSLSDRQSFHLGMNLGLGVGEVRTVAGQLHRLLLDLVAQETRASVANAAAAADRYRRSAEFDDDSNLLAAHKSDARAFVSSLEPWVTGRQARTGDSYQWAMLSVLSNRYAQHLILTDSAQLDEQRLVGEYVSALHDRMLRRVPVAHAERLWRDTATDSQDSYDRTFRLSIEEELRLNPAAIYHAFVREAQGEGFISDNYSGTSAAEREMATEWAHIHGIHVYTARADEPPRRIRDTALIWFTLADGAQNEIQGFAHAIRGVLALGSAIDHIVQPAIREAGRPTLRVHDPRLAEAIAYLADARTFNRTPGETMAALSGLYPGARDVGSLIDEIERSVEYLTARLLDVDSPDRRVISAAAGARR